MQLALGKAEARDAVDAQRDKIAQALRRFESSADRMLTDRAFQSGRLWDDLVERASRLEAEFEAVRHGWLDERGAQRQMLEATQQELLRRLRAYRDDLRVSVKWHGRVLSYCPDRPAGRRRSRRFRDCSSNPVRQP
ncbi:MAG: hypothetical protein MRJ92_01845 [Nitrospira sp.]|nr:hypothetical protein [Nitrospira sp.]